MLHTNLRVLQRLQQFGLATGRRLSLGRSSLSRLVLGIETSCDDTGAAVVDETGEILGESLHSQKDVHLRLVVSCVTSKVEGVVFN